MERKYQVFISSTYEDLKDERKELIQALLEMDCIPSGMELFQACNTTQWHLIQNVISSCDFYIVIIAGRYGSVHPETGISFTQMEYEYACKIGIPVFAFFHQYPDELPVYKVEKEEKSKKKLQDFKNKILSERLIKYWTNPYDLASSLKTAIFQAIKDNPPGGWVRYKDVINNKNFTISKTSTQANASISLDEKYANNTINICRLIKKNTNNNFHANTDKINNVVYQIPHTDILNLTNLHIDALEEITNIIFSAGMTSMNELLGISLKSNFPQLKVCKNQYDIQNFINHYGKSEYGMISEFYSNIINGIIYMNFNSTVLQNFHSILAYTPIDELSKNDFKCFQDAMHETSSIFTGNSLKALSFILHSIKIQMSPIIQNKCISNINLFKESDTIFITKLSNAQNDSHLIDAYLILNTDSIKNIFQIIDL